MKLTDAAIGRFRAVWEMEFPSMGLTDAEAQEYAGRLLTLVRVVSEGPPRGRSPPLSE
jgi:hypothetical protein